MGRRTAEYVIKILKGTPPGKLPVVDFQEYTTYVNLSTAQQLGIEIPRDVLRGARVVANPERKQSN
jgi:putative ABC transport system substrate-binding protein